jgi:chromosome segregation protein
MYLRSLKLAGFKSFADRTRLEFEPGVTVVVGPNGSGKSNVVDALGWVMGTQSPSSLRTQKMEDVIFAGTATRPELGRAEVTIIFDNASGRLPLDLPEVSITRRLYRDGSSDYEINGVGCRLLDIQELLSDSGVGRQQHILVGQGQITQILTAKPEDHRAVIEEAAGILKHRLRKDRSVRRLERTDADVLRLEDILRELKRQIRPLKRQADDAARHGAVKDELRAIRLWLGGERLRSIDARLAEVATAEHAAAARLEGAEASLAAVEAGLPALEAEVGAAGARLDKVSESAARLEAILERTRGMVRVARERRRSLAARLEGADERREDLGEEANELRIALESASAEETAARAAVDSAELALRALEDEERSLAEQESLPTEGAVAVVRGDLRSLEAARSRDARELGELRARSEQLASAREATAVELEELAVSVVSLEDAASRRALAKESASESAAEAANAWATAMEAVREAEHRAEVMQSRLDAIEAVVAGAADPRARDHAKSSGGDLGTITEVLDVPSALAGAVDAALGQWQDALVYDDPEALARAAATVKRASLGGVPLLAGRPGVDTPARPVAAEWGVDALLDRLGPTAQTPVAVDLLGDVVLVDGWAIGWEIVAAHPDVRAVTLDGDVVTAHGVRLADPSGATPAMVEAARETLSLAEDERAEARQWERRAREEREVTAQRLKAVEVEYAEATTQLEAARRRLDSARHSETEQAGALDRTLTRISHIEEGSAGRDDRIAELTDRLTALEGEEAERQRAWEELVQRRSAVVAKRDEARVHRQATESALGAIIERRSILTRRLEAVEREAAELAQTRFDPEALDRLDRIAESGSRAEVAIVGHIEALRAEQQELRAALGDRGQLLADERRRREALHAEIAEVGGQRTSLSIESTELSVRREGVCEALRRDADAEEDVALSAAEPELPEGVDADARAATLEADLRRMGPINPLAAQEFAELDERRAFLDEQLADLEASRAEIRRVIAALDDEVRIRFKETFEKVAAAFEEHVGILFPGGRGTLVLTDPDDLLTSGVDITVQPQGKKISRLSLLSGGEKSMAALAFLFAVFRAAPSPFYVLDEVEAALDDANLRRFLSLVDAFRGASQLIIVTHQQQTMEAADTLYGVTMEPGGSTRVVAKRFADAQRDLELT